MHLPMYMLLCSLPSNAECCMSVADIERLHEVVEWKGEVLVTLRSSKLAISLACPD